MQALQALADSQRADSLAISLRRRRWSLFLELLQKCGTQSLRILDVGGTESFWETMGFADSGHSITVLNLFAREPKHENIVSVVGDASSMPEFDDNEFDIVFSNSVIEHLRTAENQWKMAAEVRRLAPRYFIQTPNYYFPIEPHFLFPGFHYLPVAARVWLIRHYALGWYDRIDDLDHARHLVGEIRLLRKRELRAMFPDAVIRHERILGLTKSLMAIRA
jgi:2-polyprenyl-3-methyl-5-hydroxy-6-metoxy-1,4-benzoquinol methylase